MSALREDVANRYGIVADKKRIWVTDVFGNSRPQSTARVKCWLPGDESPIEVLMILGRLPTNILGLDLLRGRAWVDSKGKEWVFGLPTVTVRLLQSAPELPPSKVVNVKPYPLPLGAREGIAPVISDLKEKGIIIPVHSPYNSPVWPVRKPDGRWRLTVDYRHLNANTGPLTAAVPNIAELIATIQEQAHPILATIDVKDMFFMVPLQDSDRERFAFTWEGVQYTFTRLPQGYCHSPTIAHYALAQELAQITPREGVKIYQYIDDVLIGGPDVSVVGRTQEDIITHLENLGLQIPTGKIQLPSPEVKFLGIWWRGGTVCIPSETLTTLQQVKAPGNKRELQHALGLLVFWRKHIPDFSIIARPLYDLTRKRTSWEWTPVHEEALKLLIFEAGVYQALGPIHPTDPLHIEWGFAIHGLSIHMWQRGPEGPTRPVGFYSRSFKDAEKRYSIWEKGLFVVNLALQEAEKITKQQPIILRGPFKVLKPVLAGTPPPAGVAQRETVRKWYAQLDHYCHARRVEEGALKVLQIQEPPDSQSNQDTPPSLIKPAPPFEPHLKNVWFTDASSKREGKVWKYRAVALHVDSGERIITEGEGSAQVGELVAVWSVIKREAENKESTFIYTDSYAVFKGCTEWLPFWEQNQWEVNRIPVWQREKWEEILEVAKQGTFLVGWVAAHQRGDHPAHIWNNQVDSLTRLAPMAVEAEEKEWERLLEWLHVRRGHSGVKDLFREAGSRGWPVTRELCNTITSACSQCRTRLERHPLQGPPLHLRDGKGLWETWQVDYIGPFKKSEGKQYILVGVEVVSGLVQAEAVARATGENTVKVLKRWFSYLPKPKSIQSDNGSHFTAGVVQEWAKDEGVQWTFHTPYYPQANGIVERTNGLLKHALKLHSAGWPARLPDAVAKVNNRWGKNGCPKLTAFCPKPPSSLPGKREDEDPEKPLHYPGQPVLADLPTIGEVPLTLKTPLNLYTWVATDAHGKDHRIHTRWIIPSF